MRTSFISGDFLLRGSVLVDVALRDVHLFDNNVDERFVWLEADGGSLAFEDSSILNNSNRNATNNATEPLPTHSLLHVSGIGAVLLLTLLIADNAAARYLVLDGDYSGDLALDDVHITGNANRGLLPHDALFAAHQFAALSVKASQFRNNEGGSTLFEAALSGNLTSSSSNFSLSGGTVLRLTTTFPLLIAPFAGMTATDCSTRRFPARSASKSESQLCPRHKAMEILRVAGKLTEREKKKRFIEQDVDQSDFKADATC